jgi:uncharacterized phiE125 gp8 family phage protein
MNPRYKLKTAPSFFPADLRVLKINLHFTDDDDVDELLQELMLTAIDMAQQITGRQFALATYTAYLDAYPDNDIVDIDLGPVQGITSVGYYPQGSDTLTQIASSGYQLDNVDLTARLKFKQSFVPDPDRMNAIEIEFTTGWPSINEVPQSIKDAIILIASERYLNPDGQGISTKASAAQRLLHNFKIQRF